MKTNHQLSRPQITDTKNQLWHQIPEKTQVKISGGSQEKKDGQNGYEGEDSGVYGVIRATFTF